MVKDFNVSQETLDKIEAVIVTLVIFTITCVLVAAVTLPLWLK